MFLSLMSLPSAVESSVNDYLRTSNLMDVKLTSTVGFSGSDAYAIEDMDSVEAVMPISSVNALLDGIKASNGQTATAKVMSLNTELAQSTSKYNINKLTLKSGRFPTKQNECIVNAEALTLSGLSVGKSIKLTGDGEDILTSLSGNEYKIVGTVTSPVYLTKTLGSENVGSGELDVLVYVPGDAFITDSFSEIYIKLSGLEKYNYSGNKYFEKIQKFSEDVIALGNRRLTERIDAVIAVAQKQLDNDRASLNAYTQAFEKELAEIKNNIDKMDTLATDCEAQIKQKKSELEKTLTDKQNELLNQKSEIARKAKEYLENLAQYEKDKEKFYQDKEAFKNDFEVATTEYANQYEKVLHLKASLEKISKKIELNEQVVESFTDPTKLPDFEALIATGNYDEAFILQLRDCAADPTGQMAVTSLETLQGDYDAKKLERENATTLLEKYKQAIDNYSSDEAKLDTREKELKERIAQLNKDKAEIEKSDADILSGDNSISTETLSIESKIKELEIEVEDAKRRKSEYESKYGTLEAEGKTTIENYERVIEKNSVLVKYTDKASWSVADVRSIHGYDSVGMMISSVSGVSKISSVLALALSIFVCVFILVKLSKCDYRELITRGSKLSTIATILLIYLPLGLLAVLCAIAATTYLLPEAVERILSLQFNIESIEIPVPMLYMIIAAGAVVLSAFIYIITFALSGNKEPHNKKPSRISAKRKREIARNSVAVLVSISLVVTSGLLCLSNYLENKTGLAEKEGILYDAVADLTFPTDLPDESVFENTAVKEFFFAQKQTITGISNFDFIIVGTAKNFEKFVMTKEKLTDNGAIISERLANELNKKVGESLSVKLPDGTNGSVKIIGISDNTTEAVMYITNKCYQENFGLSIVYNFAYLIFKDTKQSTAEISEAIMKNAVISKVSSLEATNNELLLNNSISNIILLSVFSMSLLWTVLSVFVIIASDRKVKRKNSI